MYKDYDMVCFFLSKILVVKFCNCKKKKIVIVKTPNTEEEGK